MFRLSRLGCFKCTSLINNLRHANIRSTGRRQRRRRRTRPKSSRIVPLQPSRLAAPVTVAVRTDALALVGPNARFTGAQSTRAARACG
jgi:hypothetical protein